MLVVDTSEVQRWGGMLASEAAQVVSRIEPAVSTEQRVVQARAIAMAGVRTGAMRASIRPGGSGLRRKVTAGNRRAYYARFQEFGTRKMSANPFLLIQANPAEQAMFEGRVNRALGQGEVYR
jgi:HK97 gp10 family phage protein